MSIDFVKKLYRSRFMLKMMAMRELRATYVGSFFGFFWAVLNPLSQILIYGVVFGIFFKSSPPPQYGTDSYFLYLVSGLIPWMFFAQVLNVTPGIILANKNLIKKAVGFPSEVLPIVSVISNIINQIISVGLLLIIIIVLTGKVSPYIFAAFIYLFFISIFCVGLGWILSSVTVFLRDVPQIVGLVLTGLFFFTPIFYSSDIVPAKFLFIMKINPMYHMIEGYRLAFLAGKFLPLPDMAYLAVSSFITLVIGGIFFRRLKPEFAEVI